MDENRVNVVHASTIQEVLYHLKNTQNITVLAGATLCEKHQNGINILLPEHCIFIGNISELKEIIRTERYIDFGAAVTINQLLDLGKNRIPQFLYEAAFSIASHNIGNIATIGGNICHAPHKKDLYSPLLALDAILEIRSFADVQHIPLSKFTGIPQGYFLTKIRVPIADWNTATYVKLGSAYEQSSENVSFTFLADSSKGFRLGDLRIAFAGEVTFRSRELENTLIGSRLPLSEKDCTTLIEKASKLYDDEVEKSECDNKLFLKSQFIGLLEQSLDELKHY